MTTPIPSDVAVRLNYHDGMFLTSALMAQGQNYFINWITLQNRNLYTAGVLSGLQLSGQNQTLTAQPGFAIDGNGNFLVFPGSSNNTLTVGSASLNPFGVYLQYPPQNAGASTDTVNTAAVLQTGDTTGNPNWGVILAEVHLDGSGSITSVTDRRVPVTSKLPADLGVGNGASVDLTASKQGVARFDPGTLASAGATATQTIRYVDAGVQAFARVPNIFVNVAGAVPYATEVTAVGTASFNLTLTAVQAAAGDDPIQVNWLAVVAP
ncbi:Uncharacterised protein [Delftia tsuruhatensis]|uniref:hypothetical protein n=1 Tax=Delftia tsuruhatensis TaxID=180282 RepID=UPI001E78B88E|nr:hypothetical protein [Delftia tsuruhatensis]CAB5669626.1 Uncharacterised protein [Delftia tsuruhatensis]CAC9682842.1 Uncharacterised protein [Delftia tsuruhatensis]